MLRVCPKCKHLMEEGHECPTPEYMAAVASLIDDACEAEDMFGLDALEDFARKQQTPPE